MKQGNGLVLATSPNLIILPEFGEVLKLSKSTEFFTGEYVWIILKPTGEVKRIDKLIDEHTQTKGIPDELVEFNTLAPLDTICKNWNDET